jgi:thiamine-monophosphate kinase
VPLPERELIARIRRAAGRASRAVIRGIGDDCAVLRVPAGHEALITTDFSLEGVHFRRDWHAAEVVGHRCLTRGLSDIAAMGGDPIAAFLSLALPADVNDEWVKGFLRGFTRLARRYKVTLAGGDTAQSRAGILADIVVLGSVPRGKAVARSGARVGDDIFVTGKLGGAAAVLHRMMSDGAIAETGSAAGRVGRITRARREAEGGREQLSSADRARQMRETIGKLLGAAAERAHFLPTPRIEVGRWLRERNLASAMIDISDGLSTDLSHICEESETGAWIAEAAIPIAAGATLDEALNGGDDYELLFTAAAAKHERIPERIAGVPIRWIGTVTGKSGMWIVAPNQKYRREIHPRGWEHFR